MYINNQVFRLYGSIFSILTAALVVTSCNKQTSADALVSAIHDCEEAHYGIFEVYCIVGVRGGAEGLIPYLGYSSGSLGQDRANQIIKSIEDAAWKACDEKHLSDSRVSIPQESGTGDACRDGAKFYLIHLVSQSRSY